MIKTQEEKLDTLLSRSQVPIIDLAHCGTEDHPHKSVVNKAAQQLQKALTEKGFALLVNHGISEEKLQHAYEMFDEFCKLPDDAKESFRRRPGESQGYESPSQDRSTVAKDLKHAFNICTFGAANVELPSDELIPGFRTHFSELCHEFKLLASFIMKALAIALELPVNYFVDRHSHVLEGENENLSTMRLLYYPPLIDDDGKCELVRGSSTYSYQKCALDRLDIRIPDLPDCADEDVLNQNVTRCKEHVDYGSFTFVAQDSEGGLEVQLPGSEKWHRLGHLPGSIVISTGELVALWTQERFPALVRRRFNFITESLLCSD